MTRPFGVITSAISDRGRFSRMRLAGSCCDLSLLLEPLAPDEQERSLLSASFF
ncbi:hypothetical protein KJ969_05760 [Patescibacteria group bacterium]|nr:hypothetical protein [Patescibacteria group bacterium]